MSVLRSEQLIEAWRQKYVEGDIEVWEFEEGVWRAMTGASSRELIAEAEGIRSERERPEPDEWFRLAHERRLAALEAAQR